MALDHRCGADPDLIPEAVVRYVENRRGYDYAHHGKATSTHVDFVTDDIIDRFCILGRPAARLERLEELHDLGVDQFALYLQHDGQDKTLTAYGEKVVPQLA